MARREQLDPLTRFPELYESEYPAVYRSVRAILLDAAEAEDVTQEAFVKAYRARASYRPTAPVGAWLHRIAVNTAISHIRRRRLARLLPVRLYTGPASGGYDAAEARTDLEGALAALSPRVRAVVALHWYQGFTREEIGRVLGIPAGTVASRLAKAIRVMRRHLAVAGDPPAPAARLEDEGA